jgi:O-antigen/teichoic acid export membrane protein
VGLSILILTIFCILTGVILILWGDAISRLLGFPNVESYLVILPASILLTGLYNVLSYWGIRTKSFSLIAKTKFSQAVATLAIQLLGYKMGSFALLVGQVAGQSVGTSSLARALINSSLLKHLHVRTMRQQLFRYRKFPAYTIWASLANTVGHQLPPVLFSILFSTTAAGLYSIATRLLTIPAGIVGGALSQVFLSHGIDSERSGKLDTTYTKLQEGLFQLAGLPALLVVLVGPDLFGFFLGTSWVEAGIFARWLSIGVFLGFVASPLSHVFTIMEKQQSALVLQLALFSFRLFGILLGLWEGSALAAVIYFSLGSAVGYILYIYAGAKICGISIVSTTGSFLKSSRDIFISATPFLLCYWDSGEIMMAVAAILSVAIYAVQLQGRFRNYK